MWLEDMFNLYIQQRDTETSDQLNIASKFRSTDAERFYKTLVTRYHRSCMNIKNNLTRQQQILLNQVRSEETFLFDNKTIRASYKHDLQTLPPRQAPATYKLQIT